MKSIETFGGPLICVNAAHLSDWGGIARNAFFSDEVRYQNDYHQLISIGKSTITLVEGKRGSALCMAMPIETAIIESRTESVTIARVDYAEEAWEWSDIKPSDIGRAERTVIDSFLFQSNGGEYRIFDATYAGGSRALPPRR